MTVDPSAAHRSTPAELAERLDAERTGLPFLVHRDETGRQAIVAPGDRDRLSIGRGDVNDIALPWDPKVSRVHAELARVGATWVVEDDGLSRNGTFVNEQRINGRRRLRDGDVIRVGGSALRYSDPAARRASSVTLPDRMVAAAPPSEAQRRVLVALCRPLAGDQPGAMPATNREIAGELFLSLDAVKTHLRALFEKFEIGDEAQNRKRVLLARRALDSGVVSPCELELPGS